MERVGGKSKGYLLHRKTWGSPRLYRFSPCQVHDVPIVLSCLFSNFRAIQTGLLQTCHESCHNHIDLGPNFRNFPKTFSKDLSMSDNLGIPKVFLSEFLTAFFAFSKNFFSYLSKLVNQSDVLVLIM